MEYSSLTIIFKAKDLQILRRILLNCEQKIERRKCDWFSGKQDNKGRQKIKYPNSEEGSWDVLHSSMKLRNNCQNLWWSETLIYTQLNCHSFIYAGRRYKTPRSETKNFIAHRNNSSQFISIYAISQALNPPEKCEEYQVIPAHGVYYVTKEEPWTWVP